ncbi:MAG: hypothetical protein ACFCUR_08725 [Rhodomicrobiaceae bacterium]
MKARATVWYVLLIALLGGCSQSAGLQQFSQLLPGGGEETAEETESAEEDLAGGPPLPERNASRAGVAETASDGETQQAGLTLPDLSEVKLFTASTYAPDTTQWDEKPVLVYTRLAQQIRACWLTPAAPKLPGHGFHAEVGAGDADEAKIILYKKAEDGKRGLQAYSLTIDGQLTGSTVSAQNRKLDKKLDQAFKSDLARWSRGDQSCKS